MLDLVPRIVASRGDERRDRYFFAILSETQVMPDLLPAASLADMQILDALGAIVFGTAQVAEREFG